MSYIYDVWVNEVLFLQYMGSIVVFESMKSLDFDTRTALAKLVWLLFYNVSVTIVIITCICRTKTATGTEVHERQIAEQYHNSTDILFRIELATMVLTFRGTCVWLEWSCDCMWKLYNWTDCREHRVDGKSVIHQSIHTFL